MSFAGREDERGRTRYKGKPIARHTNVSVHFLVLPSRVVKDESTEILYIMFLQRIV